MALRCPNIVYKGKQGQEKGEFRCNDEGFRWMGNTFKVSIKKDLMGDLEWAQIGPKLYQLKLQYAAEGAVKKTTVRFDGFLHHNYQELQTFVKKSYKQDIKNIPVCTKGWNWGDFEFQPNSLLFEVDKKKGFELDYESIQMASIQTKNELEITFHPEENKSADCLTHMRIFIPAKEEEDGDAIPSQAFYDKLAESANIVIDQSKAIAQFKDVHLITPRGRYTIHMFGDFFDLHGKTYSHKISYEAIERMFLLDIPNELRMFVIQINPPLRIGQTPHHFMILRFSESDNLELDLNITPEEIEKHYKDQLAQELYGPSSDVVSRVFKALVNKDRTHENRVKVLVPGNFESAVKMKCIRCSLKANDGFLFPMKQSFFFLHKPTTYIRHNQVQNVEFSRVWGGGQNSSNKTFDLIIHMRNGESAYTFTSIQRDEYENLFKFLATRKLEIEDREEHVKRMSSSLLKGTRTRGRAVGALDDAYVQRMKNSRADAGGGSSADDDSDSSDEDFNEMPDSDDIDSEEYHSKSEPSDSEPEDADMSNGDKKKKRKRAHGESSSSSSSSKKARG